MDAEIKELLKVINENKKPFWLSIVQSIIVAVIMAIPTGILVANRSENRMIKYETKNKEIIEKVNYNLEIIADEINQVNGDHSIKLIPLKDE